LARRFVQRLDRNDCAVISYLEVAHVRDFHRGWMPRRREPRRRAAEGGAGDFG
jgi:hypothetical protein